MEEDTGFGLLDYMRSDEEPALGRMAIGMGFIILLIFLVLYDDLIETVQEFRSVLFAELALDSRLQLFVLVRLVPLDGCRKTLNGND